MPIGEFRKQVMFRQRGATNDGAGNYEGAYSDAFSRAARLTPLRGGEEVIAARLQGIQPVIVRVRSDSQTRAVDTTWRLRDQETNNDYDIKSIINVDEKNIYLDIMCVSGTAG